MTAQDLALAYSQLYSRVTHAEMYDFKVSVRPTDRSDDVACLMANDAT
jgi:hypothetical protein